MSAGKRSAATAEGRTVMPLVERPRGHFLAVRECYVAICRGDVIAAALLDVLCSWTKSRLKAIGDPERRDEERRRVRGRGRVGRDSPLWVYRTSPSSRRTCAIWRASTRSLRARRSLEKWGFIRAEQPRRNRPDLALSGPGGNVEKALRGLFSDRAWREIAPGSMQPVALPEHDFAMVDDGLLSICTIESARRPRARSARRRAARPDPARQRAAPARAHREGGDRGGGGAAGRGLGGEPVVAALQRPPSLSLELHGLCRAEGAARRLRRLVELGFSPSPARREPIARSATSLFPTRSRLRSPCGQSAEWKRAIRAMEVGGSAESTRTRRGMHSGQEADSCKRQEAGLLYITTAF